MASPRISNPVRNLIKDGFTLIEILVVVGLIAIIISLGLILSMDFYRTYAFNYEKDLIVSLLQKARSQSMANISQLTHGVRFDMVDYEYKVLKGGSVDQVFEANKSIAITITGSSDVIFSQLDGACECPSGDIEIMMVGFGKEVKVKINKEGRIDYD